MKLTHLLLTIVAMTTITCTCWAATTYTVDCTKGQSITSALQYIKHTTGGHATINIYGTCNENITISGLDRVSLVGHSATLMDPTQGQKPIVSIQGSGYVTLTGLSIQGGLAGIQCLQMSTCDFESNTVSAKGDGIVVSASKAVLRNNNFNGNGFGRGGGNGLTLQDGAVVDSAGDVILETGGNGILATNNSTLLSTHARVIANEGDGIVVESGSTVRFTITAFSPSNIEGNWNGITLGDQANVTLAAADVVQNNSGYDVNCSGRFPVATTTYAKVGTTDCQ